MSESEGTDERARKLRRRCLRGRGRHGARKNGMAVLWVILAVPALVILLCLVIEIGNLWLARVELTDALESAALAAAKEWGDAGGVGGTAGPRSVGIAYAGANTISGNPVVLTDNFTPATVANPNENASCTGNLVFGSITSTNPEVVFNAGVAPSCSDSSGPNLSLVVANSTDAGSGWKTVTLPGKVYGNMVVIGTPNYERTDPPAVVRVRAAAGSSFQFMVQNVNTQLPVSGVKVHFMVVEAGNHTLANGKKMEARKVVQSTTDNAPSNWNALPNLLYSNPPYNPPVVLGQVMTANDNRWSVFWSRAFSRVEDPPNSGELRVGKHIGEDPITARVPEEIGFVVIESGSGVMSGVPYTAALGSESVVGMDNGAPISYPLADLSSASVAVASQSAMKGNNGSWAVLYGCNPVTPTQLNLAVDEDQLFDTERTHVSERVAYIVFGGDAFAVRAQATLTVPSVCENLFGGMFGPFSVSAHADAFYQCGQRQARLTHVDQFCP